MAAMQLCSVETRARQGRQVTTGCPESLQGGQAPNPALRKPQNCRSLPVDIGP
jgi:hypothetical protein